MLVDIIAQQETLVVPVVVEEDTVVDIVMFTQLKFNPTRTEHSLHKQDLINTVIMVVHLLTLTQEMLVEEVDQVL